jgi:hypothetical protein
MATIRIRQNMVKKNKAQSTFSSMQSRVAGNLERMPRQIFSAMNAKEIDDHNKKVCREMF